MRIGLNATCFNDRPSGANQRFAGIYGALIAHRPDVEFIIYEPVDCQVSRWFGEAPNVVARPTTMPSAHRLGRLIKGMGFWRRALAEDRLDLFETFHLPLVRAARCPTILTVHDARPVLEEVNSAKRAINRRILHRDLRDADHVITVSETMKAELLEISPAAAITSIYNGIDPAALRLGSAFAADVQARLDLPARFILAVGHLESRKNYPRLIEAVARLRRWDEHIGLVIVGNDSGEGAALRRQISALGLQREARLLSGVSRQDLAEIYALSAVVAFPSSYEGFGIPILEAMVAERPVVLSDIPVFRELTQNRGCYFPANDDAAMASGIAALLKDEQRQRELVDYGKGRVRDFSFARLAAEVENVHRMVV